MGKDLKGRELGIGIRQNKNGKYEARYVDRFGKRVSIYGTNKADIIKQLAEAKKEQITNQSVFHNISVSRWYQEWFEKYKDPVLRKTSKLIYQRIFQAFILPEIGSLNTNEVKPMHIANIINQLNEKGYGWETQNKTRILLTDLFNQAIENDLALKNPARSVRLKKNKPNNRIVLTEEQQKDFFECSSGTFYNNLFVVMLHSGLRGGEVCALTERDLDFENDYISVDAFNGTLIYQKLEDDEKKEFHLGAPKTKTSIRKIPMTTQCKAALKKQITLKKVLAQKYPNETEYADLLFVTKFNTPICTQVLNDAIARIVEEINLQRDKTEQFPSFSAHTFRHTFATRCIEAGVSPKTLQKYLGHATLEMTMNLYVHITEDFEKSEILKFESEMAKTDFTKRK